MPAASILLLAIAVLLTALAVAGYLRAGRLLAQHRAWLVIAVIFVVVSVGVGLLS